MKHRKGFRLLKKYLYGTPGGEEKATVDKWYEGIDETKTDPDSRELPSIKEQIYQRIVTQRNSGARIVPFSRRILSRFAAAVILVAGISAVYDLGFYKTKTKGTIADTHLQRPSNDIAAPASNNAILTLADGSSIVLDSVQNGSLARQGNSTVSKLNNGKIAYHAGAAEMNTIEYNTLTVPRGSKPVQLLLADGSEVWLNVASSITYPTAFVGKERKVTINGEAYFEIAHNKEMPFIVKKNDMEVHVLGTHFNVNAYDDERLERVTLLEGAVKISRGGEDMITIKPGQQAEIAPGGTVKLNNDVDLNEVMAWKDGWFDFNSLRVPDIMRQIGKWYDVEVAYEGKMNQKHFSGSVSRANNVSEVLKIMEQADIKFRIEGKKITVIQ